MADNYFTSTPSTNTDKQNGESHKVGNAQIDAPSMYDMVRKKLGVLPEDIASKSDVYAVKQQVATNTNDIATLKAKDTNIDSLTSQVSTNTIDIANLKSKDTSEDVATLKTEVAQNTQDIATNKTAIASNTSSIATNATGLTTANTNIATNTSNISTLKTEVAKNTSDIADIKANGGGSSADLTQIKADIQTNKDNIATNTTDISTNKTNISSNTTAIGTNTTDISTLKTEVAQNTTDISTNKTNIATNTTNITANTTTIAKNTSDISKLKTGVTSNTNDLTTLIDTTLPNLDARVTTNATNIATNKANIASNTQAIAELQNNTSTGGFYNFTGTSYADIKSNYTVTMLNGQLESNITDLGTKGFAIQTTSSYTGILIGSNTELPGSDIAITIGVISHNNYSASTEADRDLYALYNIGITNSTGEGDAIYKHQTYYNTSTKTNFFTNTDNGTQVYASGAGQLTFYKLYQGHFYVSYDNIVFYQLGLQYSSYFGSNGYGLSILGGNNPTCIYIPYIHITSVS